jgi:hypothetical protein
LLGGAAAVALVGIYLGIAAAAHLTPWQRTSVAATPGGPRTGSGTGSGSGTGAGSGTGSGAGVSSGAGSGRPSAAASPDASGPSSGPPSPAQALQDLIPGSIRAGGCSPGKLMLGATAVRNCSGVSYGPGKTGALVSYYLFADNTTLDKAYTGFLAAAKVPRGTGNCDRFRSFRAPCETKIRNSSPQMTGRAVEFTHQGYADIVSSDEERHVLVWVTARDGQAMLKWWVYPQQWLVTS